MSKVSEMMAAMDQIARIGNENITDDELLEYQEKAAPDMAAALYAKKRDEVESILAEMEAEKNKNGPISATENKKATVAELSSILAEMNGEKKKDE